MFQAGHFVIQSYSLFYHFCLSKFFILIFKLTFLENQHAYLKIKKLRVIDLKGNKQKTYQMVCKLCREHQQMHELFENHVENKEESTYQDA